MSFSGEQYSYEAAKSESFDDSLSDDITLGGDELDDTATLPSKWSMASDQARDWISKAHSVIVRRFSAPDDHPDAELPDEEAARGLLADDLDTPTARLAVHTKQIIPWIIKPLPSFTHGFFIKSDKPAKPRRSTEWLDGLRGFASLFVFVFHYIDVLHPGFVAHGFGADDNWSIFALPVIKTVHNGGEMVAIFFCISGYVLSRRCILIMRGEKQNQAGSLFNVLSSMAFRRGLRLFIPSVVASFLAYLFVLCGFIAPQHPENWTLWKETMNYLLYLKDDLFKFWSWEYILWQGWYARHLWTIPIEYKCSVILFGIILMVARCHVPVRFIIEAALMTWFFYVDRWEMALFVAGMMVAEFNIIQDERKKANAEKTTTSTSRRRLFSLSRLRTLAMWLVFLTGIYVSGYPQEDAVYTPGYDFLSEFWAVDWDYKWRFWLAVGAILIVLSTSCLAPLQRLFSTSLARYLGRISYALYLIHPLMNATVRFAVWRVCWRVVGYRQGAVQDIKYDGGWALATLFYFPFLICVADLFSRAVDEPVVRFSRWFEAVCFVKDKDKDGDRRRRPEGGM